MFRRLTPRTSSSSASAPFALLVAVGLTHLSACVGTELQVPGNHPGHPEARAGRIYQTQALTAAYGLEAPGAPSGASAASSAHAGHDHSAESTKTESSTPPPSRNEQTSPPGVFTCPMHPDIVRKEPGECPICGMKLVPRKGRE